MHVRTFRHLGSNIRLSLWLSVPSTCRSFMCRPSQLKGAFLHPQEAGELVQVLQADEDVANCVKPHPSLPLLATSGIESVIRCVSATVWVCLGDCWLTCPWHDLEGWVAFP